MTETAGTGSDHSLWGQEDTLHPRGHGKHLPTPTHTPLPPRPRSGPPDWRWPYAPSAGQRAFSGACNHPGPPSGECPGWRGRDCGLSKGDGLMGGRPASSQHFFGATSPSGGAVTLGGASCKRRLLGAGRLPSALTLMGPSRMICPSLAMLSYSWMAARR